MEYEQARELLSGERQVPYWRYMTGEQYALVLRALDAGSDAWTYFLTVARAHSRHAFLRTITATTATTANDDVTTTTAPTTPDDVTTEVDTLLLASARARAMLLEYAYLQQPHALRHGSHADLGLDDVYETLEHDQQLYRIWQQLGGDIDMAAVDGTGASVQYRAWMAAHTAKTSILKEVENLPGIGNVKVHTHTFLHPYLSLFICSTSFLFIASDYCD